MKHRVRQISSGLIVATLLAALTLSGCEDIDSPATPTATQTTSDTLPTTESEPIDDVPTTEPPSEPDTIETTDAAPQTDVDSSNQPPPQPEPRKPSVRPVEVTFDDIKLELEKDEPFVKTKRTERLDQLDGERIRIRGFILPGYQQSGLKQFVLVRDNMECCFGPGAALFDCIIVEMVGDKSTEFSVRPVAVQGVFKVQELKDLDGRQLAIYHLDGEDVR